MRRSARGSPEDRANDNSARLGRAWPRPPAGVLASLPAALKVLWTIWLAAVSVNVVVWALVSGTTARLAYPWPPWVAGPYGAALFAVSAGVMQIRRSRLPAGRRLPPANG